MNKVALSVLASVGILVTLPGCGSCCKKSCQQEPVTTAALTLEQESTKVAANSLSEEDAILNLEDTKQIKF